MGHCITMVTDKTFCLAQAAACGRSAGEATLSNQRNKFLAAQAAWTALANGDAVKAQREMWLGVPMCWAASPSASGVLIDSTDAANEAREEGSTDHANELQKVRGASNDV
jgi:hypothetical protein